METPLSELDRQSQFEALVVAEGGGIAAIRTEGGKRNGRVDAEQQLTLIFGAKKEELKRRKKCAQSRNKDNV